MPQNSSTEEKVITGFNKSCQLSLELVWGLVYHKVHLLFKGCFEVNSSLSENTVVGFDSNDNSSVFVVNSSDIVILKLVVSNLSISWNSQ